MPKKQQGKAEQTASSGGERLLAALTQQEIAQVLDALFVVLSPPQQAQALAQLAVDTRQTVQQILTAPAEPAALQTSLPASLAKLAEQWSALWREWDAIIAEAGDEEGDYYLQEEQWEPPYFDGDGLMAALEAVAIKMQPLVETAFTHGLSPAEGFVAALQRAEDAVVAGMPDWLELTEGLSMGEILTRCLLTWEWLATNAEGDDAYAFALQMRVAEEELAQTSLDNNALVAFFTALPAADQQQILQGMQAAQSGPPWSAVLKDVYSPWHAIYLAYIDQYAPEQYLAHLRLTIPQQWRNGLPVIASLVKAESYQESLTVIRETIAALLQSNRADSAWTPATALLFPTLNHYGAILDQTNDHKTLLQAYQQTAHGLGQTEVANALAVQLVSLDHFNDWQTIFRTFAQVTLPAKTRQALFQSWKTAIIRRAEPHTWGYGYTQPTSEWWLTWLIDSIADTTKGPAWFQEQITQWLATLPDETKALRAQEGHLRLLTKDLTVSRGLARNPYPKFYAVAIRPQELSAPDEQARQSYLQQLAPADLWERVIAYWQQQLHRFVPNPGAATNSVYESHAQWLVALKELAPQQYTTLLAQWRDEHHRRRNLWKALAQVGIR
jgi:hypothetical protein